MRAWRKIIHMNKILKCHWLVVAAWVIGGAMGCEQAAPKAVEMPPPEVEVSKPIVREVTDHEETTGRTDAINSVQIRARVSGYLNKVNFKDGADVKAATSFSRSTPGPSRPRLTRTGRPRQQDSATVEKSKKVYQRTLALRPSGGSTQEDVDNQRGDYEAAKAAVGRRRRSCGPRNSCSTGPRSALRSADGPAASSSPKAICGRR